MWYVWGTREVHTGFWWAYVKGRNHLEESGVEGKITLKLIFK